MSDDFTIDEHSEKIRATVNDARRLDAVQKTQLINSEEEESFDRLTRLASKLLKTPVSFVTILEKDRDFVKSHFGLPSSIAESREITAHPSFCQHIIDSGEALVLADARDSEIFRHFPSVLHLGVVAYAGVPLTTKQGLTLGTCCVVDFKKREWTDDEMEILVELSRSILTEIELRQSAVALEEFVLIAAHEIRTPLSCLKSYTQLLQIQLETNTVKDLKTDVVKIDEQIDQLGSLVTRLFDTSRIHKKEEHLRKEEVDLNQLVAEAMRYFDTHSSHKLSLTTTHPTLSVRVDKDKIIQVVSNLISNAIKYAPHSRSIDIHVSQTHSEAIVSVKDYGQGISKADRHKIFNRFYRGAHPTKTFGLGLGLFICTDIIESHYGQLTVESEEGQGSVFSFSLPLHTNLS